MWVSLHQVDNFIHVMEYRETTRITTNSKSARYVESSDLIYQNFLFDETPQPHTATDAKTIIIHHCCPKPALRL